MFNSVSYRLPPTSALTSVETSEFAEIDDALYVALDPGRGTLTVEADAALRLRVTANETAPDWCEMVVKLPDPDWLRCRSVRATLCAKAAEQTTLKIALRVFKHSGFHDHFLTNDLLIGAQADLYQASVDISPDMAQDAQGFALHVFLENAGCVLDLHDLEILGIQ